MAEPKFDKEGNLTNLEELSVQEVAGAYQEKNKAVFGRLTEEEAKRKQAEADKAKVEADLEAEKKKNNPPKVEKKEEEEKKETGPSTDELRLIAKGLSDEEIDEAKAIAKGKGITLVEALKTKTFLLFQKDLLEEREKEKAKLGGSSGSGSGDGKPKVTPGMSREDHEKAWRESQGK